MAFYRCGSDGGGELHGATIIVSTGASLIGAKVELILDSVVVAMSTIADTRTCSFESIQVAGTYTIKASHGAVVKEKDATVTAENVINKDTVLVMIGGANINVSTTETTLVGKNCELWLGTELIETLTFDSTLEVKFLAIQTTGIYTVKASDGTDSVEESVLVESSDIDNENTIDVVINFILWLYKDGDERVDVTGGWVTSGYNSTFFNTALSIQSGIKESNYFDTSGSGSSRRIVGLRNAVDLTKYNYLCFLYSNNNTAGDSNAECCIGGSKTSKYQLSFNIPAGTKVIHKQSIASLMGKHYMAFDSAHSVYMYIYQVWLEK